MKRAMKMHHRLFMVLGWLFSVVLLLMVVVMVAYQLAYEKMILPRATISGVEVSNMKKEEAKEKLKIVFSASPNSVQVIYRDQVLADTNIFNKTYDFGWAVDQAWGLGRSGNPLTKIRERATMFFQTKNIDIPIKYDDDAMNGLIGRVVQKVNQEGKPPQIVLANNGEVKIDTGVDGLQVDEDKLRSEIAAALKYPGVQKVQVTTKVDSVAIDSARINEILETANKWKGKNLRIYYRDYSQSLGPLEIYKLIGLSSAPMNDTAWKNLLMLIKQRIETEPKNAVFNFDQGKVIEFSPEVNGVAIEERIFKENLTKTIMLADRTDLEIPVKITEPKVKTGDINNLGIKTLVGVGTSKFHGSIPNRIHNLTLASARLNGALVAPGETFSLGQTIGDVSKATGYLEAYVISEGRTVLGDGGGVCQVSTTLFRAILNAGLPIVERKAHAYRVHYYEEDLGPGYDATVFFPSADLKFTNDTPGYLLIQTKVDAKNFSMRYEIYGTPDGRVATISPAKIYSQTPPLPTIYQDDPTLPIGTTKQVDWSAWGAKVSFDYKVTRSGEVLQDRTFYSTYQPWAAIYLKGTGELANK